MYQVTKKLVSPDSSVEIPIWAIVADPVHLLHYRTNYEETSKQLFRYADGTDNPLERLVHVVWDSKESYDECMADTLMQEARAYHTALLDSLGITSEDIAFQEL